ncbi:RNA-binding protein [Spirosoma agri]|uniref:Uncharacterized protein n=1 Tax=Spirosoma agri TaxID=1987381 RepID=A0A6M0IGL7_9BACT|nr:hypothetical protein [Spirosoma agri]NEU67419.1 hypothetical protein [Spirosoma agri]
MGGLIWDNPTVGVASNAAQDMNGRFGWRVFDGRFVEIDYDKSRLIVHARLPKRRQGYVQSDIKFIQSSLAPIALFLAFSDCHSVLE